jgi:hypothetical protein
LATVEQKDDPVLPPHHESDSEPVTHKEPEPTRSRSKGILDKASEIKTASIQVFCGGFVKVDLMQDLDPIGNADQFKVASSGEVRGYTVSAATI